MSEQPPVQPPTAPHQPPSQPAEGNPPTQPMTAAFDVPPAAPTAGSVPVYPPTTNRWQRATSTSGRRWALALSAAAVALLLVLGIGVTSLLVLRNHDRVNLLGDRQTARNFGQYGPGNGNGNGKAKAKGQGPRANGGRNMPGLPGGRVQGLRGLENLLGGTALHGDVTAGAGGSVQALVFQRGEVTAQSATSITLKSSDGFTGTYGLSATTRSGGASLAKGGQAFVLARASDKVAITALAMPATSGSAPSS
jgi:hypothetical protein